MKHGLFFYIWKAVISWAMFAHVLMNNWAKTGFEFFLQFGGAFFYIFICWYGSEIMWEKINKAFDKKR